MVFVGRPGVLGALVLVIIGLGVLKLATLLLVLATLTLTPEVEIWATSCGFFRFAAFLRRSAFVESIMM